MANSIIMLTDSYKGTQAVQHPPGTNRVLSYFESRGGEFDETVFFGLQYNILKYLVPRVTQADIEEAASYFDPHFGSSEIFNRADWEYIVNELSGKLPILIRAVPEGAVVGTRNVLFTVESTDQRCFWLTDYVESLLVQVWYPSTVATISREIKKIILSALYLTGDPGLIDFKLHDFGFRGVSSVESAAIGGCAHLVNFLGTDTLVALPLAREYYGEHIAGFTIPASQHSTMTSWERHGETLAYENMINKFGHLPFYAIVADSYNIYEACEHILGGTFREKVLAAEGTLVVRPDSGDPIEVTLRCLRVLANKFGSELNKRGYDVLNPKVRMIWGDGIDLEGVLALYAALERHGWSADNLAIGMGGGLLQKLHRDTSQYAFKCSQIVRGDLTIDVFKDPITDPGKASKRGRLALIYDGERFQTVRGPDSTDELRTVFVNGEALNVQKLVDIRKRAAI